MCCLIYNTKYFTVMCVFRVGEDGISVFFIIVTVLLYWLILLMRVWVLSPVWFFFYCFESWHCWLFWCPLSNFIRFGCTFLWLYLMTLAPMSIFCFCNRRGIDGACTAGSVRSVVVVMVVVLVVLVMTIGGCLCWRTDTWCYNGRVKLAGKSPFSVLPSFVPISQPSSFNWAQKLCC